MGKGIGVVMGTDWLKVGVAENRMTAVGLTVGESVAVGRGVFVNVAVGTWVKTAVPVGVKVEVGVLEGDAVGEKVFVIVALNGGVLDAEGSGV